MRIAFIGPPGAGKSTQARRLARALPHWNTSPRLSTGELVRAQIEAGTDLGHALEEQYERGERIANETILSLILPRVRRAGGWILDNFPADVAQARTLDEDLEERGSGGLSRVILLEGPSEEDLIQRVLDGRVTSQATRDVYHLLNDPPPQPGERTDPGPFERRNDDTEESLRRNLQAYQREAESLKQHYEARGVLSAVDAGKSIDEVAEEVLEVLGHPERPEFYTVPANSQTA
ncbi:MAG TPA: nucleoside monophosphate kinase [Rubrobacteraceae bacterium]|nr:nucleoside monophosphate kinase [Rubrobacteraceae bacterium]